MTKGGKDPLLADPACSSSFTNVETFQVNVHMDNPDITSVDNTGGVNSATYVFDFPGQEVKESTKYLNEYDEQMLDMKLKNVSI